MILYEKNTKFKEKCHLCLFAFGKTSELGQEQLQKTVWHVFYSLRQNSFDFWHIIIFNDSLWKVHILKIKIGVLWCKDDWKCSLTYQYRSLWLEILLTKLFRNRQEKVFQDHIVWALKSLPTFILGCFLSQSWTNNVKNVNMYLNYYVKMFSWDWKHKNFLILFLDVML